jgi:hypothetical protein
MGCQSTLDLDIYSFEPGAAVGAAGAGGASGSDEDPGDSSGVGGLGDVGGSGGSGASLELGPGEPTGASLDAGLGGCFEQDAGSEETSCADAAACTGCSIGGRCIAAGAADPDDVCRTCQPSSAPGEYSIEVGRVCAPDSANDCLEPSRCDEAGACQPVYTEAGLACGDPSDTVCDRADTCDGAGVCELRVASDTTPCDDGAFCSAPDTCVSGRCVAGGARDCGLAQVCNAITNQCECTGCNIAGTCVASDSLNPSNGCERCIPRLSTTGYVPDTGAPCGSDRFTGCSQPDTCDSLARCLPNDLGFGTPCFDVGTTCDICDGAGTCFTQATFEQCFDGIDNDCNGLTDETCCGDFTCF